jgi:hypothetical protein
VAWIESHQALLSHRKTIRLARLLKIHKLTAIGLLHAIWWWCVDNAPDGFVSNSDLDGLSDGALWEGKPAVLIGALEDSRFVERLEDGVQMHDWMDYAGKLIERRTADRDRLREHRAKVKGLIPERTPDVRRTNEDGTRTVKVPYPTQPDPTQQTVPDRVESADSTAVAVAEPAAAYQEFVDRLAGPTANVPVVLAEAVSNQYAVDCRDFGRLGKLAKESDPLNILDLIFGLVGSWSHKGNPVNYIAAAARGKAKADQVKTVTNGQATDVQMTPKPDEEEPPDMTNADHVSLVVAEVERAMDENPSPELLAFREHIARLKASGAPGGYGP